MTEAEWMVCADPEEMLEFLEARADGRKLQLFACACARRAFAPLGGERYLPLVVAAEQLADGRLDTATFAEQMRAVADEWAALPSYQTTPYNSGHYLTATARHLGSPGAALYAASFAARGLARQHGPEGNTAWQAAVAAEEAVQCALLRDIIGSPAKPFRFDSEWLADAGQLPAVVAEHIDADNQFAELPGLLTALLASGCTEAAVLDHVRSGSHVRGCWVVDALLGRTSGVRTGLVTEHDWQTCTDLVPLLEFLEGKGSVRQWRLFAVACCERIEHLITDERCRQAIRAASLRAEGILDDAAWEAARIAVAAAQRETWDAEYRAEAEAGFSWTPPYARASMHHAVARAANSALNRDPRHSDDEPGSYLFRYWRPSHELAAGAVGVDVFVRTGDRAAQDFAHANEQRVQCDLLRDVFGAHFGIPGDEPRWLPSSPGDPVRRAQFWCILPTPRDRNVPGSWRTTTVAQLAEAIFANRAFDRLPILADALEDAGCTNRDILDHCRQPGAHARGCWVVDLVLGKS